MTDRPSDEPWSVFIDKHGLTATMSYREGTHSVPLGAEMILPPGVWAISVVSDPWRWDELYPWAVGRKAEILERVAQEAIRQLAPGCHAVIDAAPANGWIEIRR